MPDMMEAEAVKNGDTTLMQDMQEWRGTKMTTLTKGSNTVSTVGVPESIKQPAPDHSHDDRKKGPDN